jgi:hypothetical protein
VCMLITVTVDLPFETFSNKYFTGKHCTLCMDAQDHRNRTLYFNTNFDIGTFVPSSLLF